MPINAIPFNFEEASKRFFQRKSPEFQSIETALNDYLRSPAAWPKLKILQRAIATWRATKVGPTIRDNAMQRLDDWIQGEISALKPWPNPEPLWGPNHNCYAYAMKCRAAVNGNNARPGRLAGRPRDTQAANFAQGVVDDALHQGRKAWILRKGGKASPVPHLTHGGYLVVMIAMSAGYHFMRRDNVTGLWTHKNGSIRPEEVSWLNPADLYLEDAITDNAMLRVIEQERNFAFDAYLEIQSGGIVVSG